MGFFYITYMNETIMRDAAGTEGLLDLIKELGDNSNKRMIEIGSFVGESTVLFAQSFGSVTAIDPFIKGYDHKDPTSYSFDFDDVYQSYLDRTKDYTNIKTLKMTSNEGYEALKFNEFDFIYIDGLHTYEGVKNDITNFLRLVRKGGAIGGHDYTNKYEHLIGVYEAVNEMFGAPDKTFKDGSWIKYV